MIEPPHPLLAQGKVRHVGDPVAAVIAETREQAKDAAELIDVSYKPLSAVVTSDAAIKPGSPLLFDTAPGNLCFDWHLGDKAAVDAAFAGANHITRLDLVNNRLVSNPMEPRAAIGEFNRGTSEYTLYTTSQAPHVHRLLIAAFVLQLPEHKLRVVAPDVGGGFGTKGSLYAEQALVLWLAGKLGRPIKWTAERSEIFLTDNQARDHLTKAELALDKDGKFLAMRVATLANLGAYLGSFAPAIPTWCYGTLLAGNYATPAIYVEVKGVFTNTAPVDAYRGAGRPEACYVVERLVDRAAREMRLDPVALRRRNFIPNDAYPYTTPVALTYDSGDYFKTLDMAVKAADYASFEQRRKGAAKRGKLRGIGISTYIEVRHGTLGDSGPTRCTRRLLRDGGSARAPHWQHHRLHRLAQPRPRPANGYSYDAVKIFMPAGSKQPVVVHYTEHCPPDVTAAFIWLKNRDPDRWRDVQNVEHELGKYIISDHPMTAEQWAAERATVVNEVIDDTAGELPAPKK